MTVLALALLAGTLASQPAAASRLGLVAFKRIEIPDDVSAHLCTALAEDRDGFLWIGTQGGLVRYDGYEFRAFRPVPDDGSDVEQPEAALRDLHPPSPVVRFPT